MSSPADINFANTELSEIRLEQARLLNEKAAASCRIVQILILVLAAVIWISGYPKHAVQWVIVASIMVGVTYFYAKRTSPKDITLDNYERYLSGHTVISGMTGLTWGVFACYLIHWEDQFSFLLAGLMTIIITIGGMSTSASYRREYIVLAACALLPFAVFILLTAPGALRFFGLATLTYFGICLGNSAQSEINTRDGILARRTTAMTEKLQAKNIEIQRASEEKTRLLAAASHDLAQPLHAQGFLIQALKKCLTDDKQRDLLDKIEASCSAQGQLLEGLVDLARLDSGAIRPKIRRLSLVEEMQILATEFQGIAARKSIKIETDFVPAIVRTDPVLLSRIIRNVLSNAVKFSPESTQIDFKISKDSESVSIIISDNGPGIDASRHAEAFEEYRQLGPAGESDHDENGLGLGLSIVNKLSELLDIKIVFESIVNVGTTFIFKLPEHLGDDLPAPAMAKSTHRRLESPLIVLVDDEANTVKGMAALLTDWHAQVISATTGHDAVMLLSEFEETPALLIVDKRLKGGENGIDVIERLREEVNETIPAILMTGDITGFGSLTPETEIALITKPVAPRDLKSLIDTILFD